MRAARGFTLLEMLVVLAIIAILSSLAAVAIGTGQHHDLHDEATRLALAFEAANDEAQLRTRVIAWQTDERGYHFALHDSQGWHVMNDGVLAPHLWQDVEHVEFALRNVAQQPEYLLFGGDAIDWPVEVSLSGAGQTALVVSVGNGRYDAR